MTPYLILDQSMLTALTYAAKRGVETVIIMPHIPDKKYAYLLARTYYQELIEAGVHIYEFIPGFVHAKMFVSDDEKAVVGTINLDYRSLYLHFECGTYLYKNQAVYQIKRDYQETLKQCEEITLEDAEVWNWKETGRASTASDRSADVRGDRYDKRCISIGRRFTAFHVYIRGAGSVFGGRNSFVLCQWGFSRSHVRPELSGRSERTAFADEQGISAR